MPPYTRSKSAVIAALIDEQWNRLRNEALWQQEDPYDLVATHTATDDGRSSSVNELRDSHQSGYFQKPATDFLTARYEFPIDVLPRNYPYRGKDYTYPVETISNPVMRTDGRMTPQEWLRHIERLTSGTVAGITTGIAHELGASPDIQDGLFALGTGVDNVIGARRRAYRTQSEIGGAWRGATTVNS